MKTDELSIPEPCSVPWNAMDGTGCRRFCGQCRQTVTDISRFSEAEARAFLKANPTACIQMDVWGDEILFAPVRRSRRRRPGRLKRLAALAALGVSSPALASGGAVSDHPLVVWISSWFATTEAEPVVSEEEPLIPELQPVEAVDTAEPVAPIRRLGGKPRVR